MPQEFRFRATQQLLLAMIDAPPDLLIVQTHSHRVTEYLDIYRQLRPLCDFRVHVSIETDIEEFPGLPPHASPIHRRFEAARELKDAGIRTVITVSPLMPIEQPEQFFARISECADAMVVDHFVQGDGTPDGSRTLRTALPVAIEAVRPDSVGLSYRHRMVEIARRYLPGRVGVNIDGFAGRYLPL